MADLQQALRTRLLDDAAVTALVGDRIHWAAVPQRSALPYVRLTTVSDVRPQHLTGFEGSRLTRIQADVFAESYGAARNLSEALVAAVTDPETVGGVRFGRTGIEGPRDLGEDVPGKGFIHRLSLDLLTEHALA